MTISLKPTCNAGDVKNKNELLTALGILKMYVACGFICVMLTCSTHLASLLFMYFLIFFSHCHDNQINFYNRAFVVLSFGKVKNFECLKSANLEPC